MLNLYSKYLYVDVRNPAAFPEDLNTYMHVHTYTHTHIDTCSSLSTSSVTALGAMVQGQGGEMERGGRARSVKRC